MKDRKLMAAMALVVVVIWLVGAAITKYDLAEMAYLAPIAVIVVGLSIGLVLLWIKIVTQLIRERGSKKPG